MDQRYRTYNVIPAHKKLWVDMYIFVEELAYRINGSPHKAPIPDHRFESQFGRVDALREAYAQDIHLGRYQYLMWNEAGVAPVQTLAQQALEHTHNGTYSHDGRDVDVSDLIAELDLSAASGIPDALRTGLRR